MSSGRLTPRLRMPKISRRGGRTQRKVLGGCAIRWFGGLFAALVGGEAITKLVVDTTQAEAATGRLAHNLSLPVKTLSEWQDVIKEVGGTADDANGSLTGIQGLMQNAAFGDLNAQRTMGILGVGANEDASQALITASKFFSTHKGALDQQEATAAGISPAMLNLLEQGPAKVQATLSQDAPNAMTQKDVDDAGALQTQWGQLQNTFSGITRELMAQVNPGL